MFPSNLVFVLLSFCRMSSCAEATGITSMDSGSHTLVTVFEEGFPGKPLIGFWNPDIVCRTTLFVDIVRRARSDYYTAEKDTIYLK